MEEISLGVLSGTCLHNPPHPGSPYIFLPFTKSDPAISSSPVSQPGTVLEAMLQIGCFFFKHLPSAQSLTFFKRPWQALGEWGGVMAFLESISMQPRVVS